MNSQKIALVGNPNVGKSTLFNYLTGMKQHTGNWSGKTVGTAEGIIRKSKNKIKLVDLPGTYSLAADSAEEEVTRDCLLFENFDAAAVVCDACCLERNLILALQTAELVPKVLIIVNMMDDARKKGIEINFSKLEKATGLPVVGISASTGEGMEKLEKAMEKLLEHSGAQTFVPVRYPKGVKESAERLFPLFKERYGVKGIYPVLAFLEGEHKTSAAFKSRFGNLEKELEIALEKEKSILSQTADLKRISACRVLRAEEICLSALSLDPEKALKKDDVLDSVLTGKTFGIPLMLILFAFIFWLTVSGANYPSTLLSDVFSKIGIWFESLFEKLEAPPVLTSLLLDGVWKVLSWVVAVMLPPMAIFFPLFTLLEDVGYLPRVAFNLDKGFKASGACGKQALTMCMGIGCGAVGVTGARIIDSPRERAIAIITNSFVPCNGRLPALIALTSMFFTDSPVLGALIMTAVLVFCVLTTLLMSKILSKTVLKGTPSAFTLELPPYRMPKIGKVIVRSVLDRTLRILGRAVAVAVPAGIIIWLCSNFSFGGKTLLEMLSAFLDPFGKIIGMDGKVLSGFVLSFPANEIALPIMAMAYSGGELSQLGTLSETAALFFANGFTKITALCTAVFFLFHWPCATTLLTVWKETKSAKYTALSVLVPLITGTLFCFIINIVSKLFP